MDWFRPKQSPRGSVDISAAAYLNEEQKRGRPALLHPDLYKTLTYLANVLIVGALTYVAYFALAFISGWNLIAPQSKLSVTVELTVCLIISVSITHLLASFKDNFNRTTVAQEQSAATQNQMNHRLAYLAARASSVENSAEAGFRVAPLEGAVRRHRLRPPIDYTLDNDHDTVSDSDRLRDMHNSGWYY